MAESTRQREAFDLYWVLGGQRSIERLWAELNKQANAPNIRTLYEWSRLFHWRDRIADLEREARAQANEARQQAIEEMYERQAKEGLLLQQKGAEWLTALEQAVSSDAAIRAIVEGAKLERLSRGEPSENFRQEGEVSYGFNGFTDEELRRIIEITKGGADGAGPPQPEQPA